MTALTMRQAPSPPHIHIPQALDNQTFSFKVPGNSGYSGEEEAILRRVAGSTHTTGTMQEWKYESRRKPQEVFPFLHLGPSSSGRDIEALRAQGITMLLVVRNSMMGQIMSGERVARQLGIELETIDVAGHQELITAFPRATKIINDHLIYSYRRLAREDDEQVGRTAWGKILIFCESGNERSAAVVAAYVMNMFALDMTTAIQFVQSRRFCVAYDDSLKNLLRSYDDILSARREVSRANPAQSQQVLSPAKRLREVEEDEVMDMGDATGMHQDADIERFVGRSSYAPFHDRD
jgi:serine/threonine/tyrosine-interacting protein